MAEKAKKDKAKAPSAQYGVLFVHYGLPSDIEDKTLRPFMRRILLDKRVRTLPLPLWLPKMQFSILGPAVQELKREISSFWNGESTYQKNCNRQRRAIALDIEDLGMANVVTASVSRYGKPGIREGLQHLTESGAKRIVVVPMAPQSSYTFTASVHDAWKKEKRRFSSDVEYRFIDNFYDDEWYIEALANNILDTVERLRPQGTAGKHRIPEVNATGSLSALGMLAKKHKLVFVYRTAPLRDIQDGDNYELQTSATALAVAERLGLKRNEWTIAYLPSVAIRSRDALTPTFEETLERFKLGSVKDIVVVAPGGVVPTIDMRHTVAIEMKRKFFDLFANDASGEPVRFTTVGALNDHEDFTYAIANIVVNEFRGWK